MRQPCRAASYYRAELRICEDLVAVVDGGSVGIPRGGGVEDVAQRACRRRLGRQQKLGGDGVWQPEWTRIRLDHAGYRRYARANVDPDADACASHGVADMAAVECPSSLIRAAGEIALGTRGARLSVFRNGCSFTFIGSEHTVGNCRVGIGTVGGRTVGKPLVGRLCAGILARGFRAVVAVDAATRF